jgi:cell division GTPase FtsZ
MAMYFRFEAEISKAIEQASIIFITASMGGGTGTGAMSGL